MDFAPNPSLLHPPQKVGVLKFKKIIYFSNPPLRRPPTRKLQGNSNPSNSPNHSLVTRHFRWVFWKRAWMTREWHSHQWIYHTRLPVRCPSCAEMLSHSVTSHPPNLCCEPLNSNSNTTTQFNRDTTDTTPPTPSLHSPNWFEYNQTDGRPASPSIEISTNVTK